MMKLVLVVLLAHISTDANAYLGPGLGAGAIGMTIGVVVSLVVGVFAVVWYPVKRVIKRRRAKNTQGYGIESGSRPIKADTKDSQFPKVNSDSSTSNSVD